MRGRGINPYTTRFGDPYSKKRAISLIFWDLSQNKYHVYMLLRHYAYMLITCKLCI